APSHRTPPNKCLGWSVFDSPFDFPVARDLIFRAFLSSACWTLLRNRLIRVLCRFWPRWNASKIRREEDRKTLDRPPTMRSSQIHRDQDPCRAAESRLSQRRFLLRRRGNKPRWRSPVVLDSTQNSEYHPSFDERSLVQSHL